MLVGHILSMPSLGWSIICSCHAVQLLFICGCSRGKKNSVCANLTLAFLAQATMRNKHYIVRISAYGFLRGYSAYTGSVQSARITYALKLAWVGFHWYLCIVWPLHFPPSLMHRAKSCQRPYSLQSCLSLMYHIVHSSFDLISNRLIYTEKKHVDITEETQCFSVFLLTCSFSI